MKKILLLVLVIAIGLLSRYYYMTFSMASIADEFFKTVKKEHNITKAETYLSEGFKKNITREQLAEYLVSYRLSDYKDIVWKYDGLFKFKNHNFGEIGNLEGIIISKDNISSPIKIQFKEENNEWKIFAIEKVLSKKEIQEQKIIAEYTTLARMTIHTLGVAVKENNMTILYNNLSKKWQKDSNLTELNKAYGIFVEKKVNFLPLDKALPKLTILNVNKNKILTLAGYYRLGKQTLYFKQNYIIENKTWKLAGLSLQFK